jgi:5-hydroxyisourate hydrolase
MPGGGLSIHAVDARDGRPAAGLRVEVFRRLESGLIEVAAGRIGKDALLRAPQLEAEREKGGYEVHFHAGDYFAERRHADDLPPLLDIIVFTFEIGDPSQHIHLPLKMTPVGYSLFKGDP